MEGYKTAFGQESDGARIASDFCKMTTQTEKAQELIEAFEMFDSWEDRYRFLIDLGNDLPTFPENAKTEENLVHGCQSQVWIIPHQSDNQNLDFLATSDSAIVRGLIGILREIYAHQNPRDVVEFDITGLFQTLELDQNLSLGRRNGLEGMVLKIKQLATQMGV